MAERKAAKTAQKGAGAVVQKRTCPSCGAPSQVTFYTGFGSRGFFWVCEKQCGYMARTRQ